MNICKVSVAPPGCLAVRFRRRGNSIKRLQQMWLNRDLVSQRGMACTILLKYIVTLHMVLIPFMLGVLVNIYHISWFCQHLQSFHIWLWYLESQPLQSKKNAVNWYFLSPIKGHKARVATPSPALLLLVSVKIRTFTSQSIQPWTSLANLEGKVPSRSWWAAKIKNCLWNAANRTF